MTSSNAEDVDS